MMGNKWILLLILIISTSCRNKVAKFDTVILSPPPMGEYPKGFVPDSNDVYTVIKFDIKQIRFAFSAGNKPTEITLCEMKTIDSLIKVSVKDYNTKYRNKGISELRELKNYRRQLVAVIDSDGVKQVYINAFTRWSIWEDSWKKHLTYINDGGSGFFHLKINLKKKIYYGFGVNGLA